MKYNIKLHHRIIPIIILYINCFVPNTNNSKPELYEKCDCIARAREMHKAASLCVYDYSSYPNCVDPAKRLRRKFKLIVAAYGCEFD